MRLIRHTTLHDSMSAILADNVDSESCYRAFGVCAAPLLCTRVVGGYCHCAGLGQTGYHWAANHLKWAGMAHFDREEHFRGVHIRVEIKPLIAVHMSNSK